ncbi:MAG: nuclear transport factor 2 family protein [Candidatus Poribacteria bacterium]|nr:nuclear transport factor 2 family protein [Candidatus Poribacteria bacterium]
MTNEQQVEQANLNFYQAMQNLSIDMIDDVWLHADWVRCVHPNWETLTGWEGIRQSWVNIFQNTHRMHIQPTEVSIYVDSQFAWVTCVESIHTSVRGRMSVGFAQATNIFKRENDDWKMVHHHASSLPREMSLSGTAAVPSTN